MSHIRPHAIKGNRSVRLPKKCIFFDTETNIKTLENGDQEHTLKLGVAIYRNFNPVLKRRKREVFRFTTGEAFYEFVVSKLGRQDTLYLYAHNIFFDLWISQFYYYAFLNGWTSKIPYHKGLTYIDELKKAKQKICLINTTNYFQCPLRTLGNVLGLKKKGTFSDHQTEEDLFDYCLRDVEIIEAAMEFWFQCLRSWDLGNYGMTLPAQAFNAYRHRFMPCKIYVHDRWQNEDFEAEGYFGGRCEAFYIGKVPANEVYKLDINSMYPAVMRDNLYPYRFAYRCDWYPLDRFREDFNKHLWMCKVLIETERSCLPLRYENRLVFPIGRFWTVLCTPELEYALRYDLIKKIDNTQVYDGSNLFQEYVDYFYSKRKYYKSIKNEPMQYACKILLNSFYGKFAQREYKYKLEDVPNKLEVYEEHYFDADKGENVSIQVFGGKCKISTRQLTASSNSLIAISAHVTSYARRLMQESIDRCPANSVYYCDTDSLFCNKDAAHALKDRIDNTKLGYWKIEEIGTDVEIHNLKHYRFNKSYKLKGVRKTATKLGDNLYEQDQWSGFPLVNKRLLTDPYLVKRVQKRISGTYLKGRVTDIGWVKPLRFTTQGYDNILLDS